MFDDIQLSPNFKLSELIVSQTAARRRLDNTPSEAIIANLRNTASQLEILRALIKSPILVSSGYRSPAVNAVVGGASNSQHMKGEAVDFTSPRFGSPRVIWNFIQQSDIDYDQCILEFNAWVHISYKNGGKNRCQAFEVK